MDVLMRAAALRGLDALVDSLGGDGAALLARFGIEPESLRSDSALIPALTAARLLEQAADRLACPDLGLQLAQRQDVRVLGPLAVAIENSPTVGEALDCASAFLFVHNPVLNIWHGPDPEGVAGVVGVHYGDKQGLSGQVPQGVDLGVGLIHRVMIMMDGDYGLRSVHLPHPPLAPVATYTGFFGADVRFDRPAAVLRIPAQLLRRPLRRSDAVLRRIALDYLATHFTDPSESLTARTRALVDQSLGSTDVRVDAVARWLRLHPRTLQRHLAAEGTTFEAVVDDARRETAHRLLTRSDLPFSQITRMVGLSEQSAFTRATRRWYATTPTQIRQSGRRPSP